MYGFNFHIEAYPEFPQLNNNFNTNKSRDVAKKAEEQFDTIHEIVSNRKKGKSRLRNYSFGLR